ncbi:DUF3160 domain-containing protein [Candidatus Dojkabacteria bacterium]|nr:DUF3160 domain-containing protein [Candidatus Dojkabacteria bacterium]
MATPEKIPDPIKKSKSKSVLPAVLLILVFSAGLVFAIYYFFIKGEAEQSSISDTQETPGVLDVSYLKFGDYNLPDIDVTPNVKNYEVKEDLSNVFYNKKDDPAGNYKAVLNKELTSNLKIELARDNFIITPGKNKEFFSVYEQNRYDFVPNFVTTDAILHTYHLIFDSSLKNLEEEYLYENSVKLSENAVQKSLEQYNSFDAGELKDAARRNVAFFSVGAKLLNPEFKIPAEVATEVNKELEMITEHTETAEISEVMAIGFSNPDLLNNLKEDYTQYIPRGHYTKSEDLKRYFNGMMWFGRMTFLTKDKSTTMSAFLIVEGLKDNESEFKIWESIFSVVNFFVGKADDLTYYEYEKIYKDNLGGRKISEATAEDLDKLWEEAKKLEPPQINSIPIFDASIQPDRDKEIKGFRFFGQRFTVDAMIFQRLMYRDVEEKETGERKMLPSSIEIPAAMGDETARDIIKSDTDFYTYPNYESQLKKLNEKIVAYPQDQWTQNLYWSWMYTLNGFVGSINEGYPQFMNSTKWEKKELNTYVGSWTELKHDTILYSKQAYAEMGDAGPVSAPDDRGYVEPNIDVWGRLLALTGMTKDGLEKRGLVTRLQIDEDSYGTCSYNDDYKKRIYCSLSEMEYVLDNLLNISVKELEETELTNEEYHFIRNVGGFLEDMFMSTLNPSSDKWTAVTDNPAMLVADVASDSGGSVLEEATGYIYNIYVIVPVDGSLRITKGGVYSQYEFVHPASDRLTDEKWREILEDGKAPEMKKWQKSLITE